MAQIIYSPNALDNLQRSFEFLVEQDRDAAHAAAQAIREAIGILANHPLVGRRVKGELRELVISYGKSGYIALYRYLPVQSQVRILALRRQRELDYPPY